MQFFTRHTCVFTMSTESQAPWWRILPEFIVIHAQSANPKSAVHQFMYIYTAMHSVMWNTPWAASGLIKSKSSVSHTALHSWCPMLQTHYALPTRAEWDFLSKIHSACTNTFIISNFHMTYFMNFAIWKNINTNFYLQILLHENAAYTVVLVTLAVLHTGVCTVPIDSCGVQYAHDLKRH